MPGGKVYVARDLGNVQAIQKQSKTLSFWPMEAKFTGQLGDLSSEGRAILESNVMGAQGRASLFVEGMKMTHQAVRPGQSLDDMNKVTAKTLQRELDGIDGTKNASIDLWAFTRHIMTLASTDGVYGSSNPYRDIAIEQAFW